MFLVGLTGGIGSGKSTAAARFRELGCELIDADVIAREVVVRGAPALAELVGRFGEQILGSDGQLDRRRLAELVFTDDAARTDLDRITHPWIQRGITARVEELTSRYAQDPRVVILDHPLLVETGAHARVDAVVVVHAPADERVRRLVEGRGLRAEDAWARLRAQTDDDARLAVADHVLDNTGQIAALRAQVDEVHASLVAAARAAHDRTAGGRC